MTRRPAKMYIVARDDEGIEASYGTALRRSAAARGSSALLAAIRSYQVREARQ